MTSWTEEPLPGMPEPPPKPKPRRRVSGRPQWRKVRTVSRPLCERCTRNAYEARQWLPCRSATYTRSQGGDLTFWCYLHAEEQHRKDGLGDLEP